MTDSMDILISRIATRLEKLGLSERQASLEATQSPDALRYIRTRRAMPSAARLQEIARVLKVTVPFLLGQTDYEMGRMFDDPRYEGQFAPPRVEPGAWDRDLDRPLKFGLPQNVPIYDSSRLTAEPRDSSEEGMSLEMMDIFPNRIIGYAKRPPLYFNNDRCFSIYVPTVSLRPFYDSGAMIMIDGRRPPSVYDVVYCQLKRVKPPHGVKRGFLGILTQDTGSQYKIHLPFSHKSIDVRIDEVDAIDRALSISDLIE